MLLYVKIIILCLWHPLETIVCDVSFVQQQRLWGDDNHVPPLHKPPVAVSILSLEPGHLR